MAALLWMLVIVVIVAPWSGFVFHPHWGQVAWIPFVSPPYRALDATLNTLLYVPLGAALARRHSLVLALALAAGLSLTTELLQVYSHTRIPSMTDVVTNVVGAWLGHAAWWRFRHQNQRPVAR